MSNSTISGAAITALEHPISALDDRPALSAADLKAYFDANPQQLCDALNQLVQALTGSAAASEIGFTSSASISADNVQEAIDNIHDQLVDITYGTIPDSSIGTEKLDDYVRDQLSQVCELLDAVAILNRNVERIRPSGAQFPLMMLALSDGCPEEMKDDLATAAFGGHFDSEIYDLGIQLGWLCRWKKEEMPTENFRSKPTIEEIFSDADTLAEIENLPCVRSLISLSSEISSMYRIAQDNINL